MYGRLLFNKTSQVITQITMFRPTSMYDCIIDPDILAASFSKPDILASDKAFVKFNKDTSIDT